MSTEPTPWFVAVSFSHWGRGRSIDEARRELLLAGGDPATHLVYRVDVPADNPPPHVSEGQLVHHGPAVLVAAVRQGRTVDPSTLDDPSPLDRP